MIEILLFVLLLCRRVASEAKLYSEAELKKTGTRPMMRPHMCGQLCCCGELCGSNKVSSFGQHQVGDTELDFLSSSCSRKEGKKCFI